MILDAGRAGPASHDRTGLRHVFVPSPEAAGWRYALDVERKDTPLDPGLSAVLSALDPSADPLLTWTRIEVAAKLLDRPAHLLLRRAQAQGLPGLAAAAGIEVADPPHPHHWISVARIPDPA